MDILKAFSDGDESYHVNILGTIDEPLFQANQIGKILGIKNMSQSLSSFNKDEKVYKKVETNGGIQEVVFLTEFGLYKLIFKSSKPIAEKFQLWVFNIIREIRLRGKYELDDRIEVECRIRMAQYEAKNEDMLIDALKRHHCVYLSKIGMKGDKTIIKIGSTNDIKKRAPQLKLDFGTSTILNVYPCVQNTQFESFLHKHTDIAPHRYHEPINQKISREMFLLDNETYEKLISIIRSNIHRYNQYTVQEKIEIEKIHYQNKLIDIESKQIDKNTENERIRLENEKNRIENERICIENEKQKLELIKMNPSLISLIIPEYKDNHLLSLSKNQEEKEEPINEDKDEEVVEKDEIFKSAQFHEKKYNHKNPKVQQYDPNTLQYIKTFESIVETIRTFRNELNIQNFSDKTLKDAWRGNYVYHGYRWNIIPYEMEDKPYELAPTVKIFSTRRDLIAQMNLDKNKILHVYSSQKHAAIAMKHSSPSALCKAVKLGTISQGHYWNFYDDCSEELKNNFIQSGGILPEVAITISGAKPIVQIDYETKRVIATYATIKEVQVKFKMSRDSLKRAIEEKIPHNSFYWAYAS